MTEPCLASVVQMTSGPDRAANLREALARIEAAADAGARLIVLPEMFTAYGPPEVMLRAAESIPGESSDSMSEIAARRGLVLVAGSIPERGFEPNRVFNTSLIFGPDGGLLSSYRKIHLFDVDVAEGESYRESSWCAPGDRISLVDTPLGRVGQAICYDLRFPELFRALAAGGAEIVVLPSAFTARTGQAHWESLIRARAIENQVYVLAADQFGAHAPQIVTHGQSLIVDPWGDVVARVGDDERFACATIDLEHLARVRARMPLARHRRL